MGWIQLIDGSFKWLVDISRLVQKVQTQSHAYNRKFKQCIYSYPCSNYLTVLYKGKQTIYNIDKAISNVGTEREQIGAVMNRLDHTIANLQKMYQQTYLCKRENRGC